MDFLLSLSTTTTILGTIVLLLFLYYQFLTSKIANKSKSNDLNRTPPEVAGAWPLIGHLHLLGGSQLLHKTLGSLADKYGNVLTIKLGVFQVLVVSDWEIAKECFTTNDKVFANRPKSIAVEIMGYNYAMFGFSPYGNYWRQIRKVTMLELLSNPRIEMLRHVRESEVKTLINELYELWASHKNDSSNGNGVKMEMKKWFGDLTLNVIVRMIVGKRYSGNDEEGARSQKAVREFFELLGVFLVADVIPFLRWFDLGGYEKAMKKIAKEMDSIAQGWLEDHKRKRRSGNVKVDQQDFMDVLLLILDGPMADKLPEFDADDIIKATCLSMLSGGTDTTTLTLTWALSLLLNNRNVLKKAQEELDMNIGRDRQVQECDMKNLNYLQAIIKETLRLYPVGPLSLPHESTEDCHVGGYRIPKGTQLLVNLWKIQRDPRVWSDPEEFRPERFLTCHKDIDVRGQNFELIPFSSGRRMCPGISLGLKFMHLTLANLIHGFEFETPLNEPVDMTESPGLTNAKATPLDVILTPRLPSNLYGI